MSTWVTKLTSGALPRTAPESIKSSKPKSDPPEIETNTCSSSAHRSDEREKKYLVDLHTGISLFLQIKFIKIASFTQITPTDIVLIELFIWC